MNSVMEHITKAKSIGIAGHIHPDGDCCGSCFALYRYIRQEFPDKEVTVYMEQVPATFCFLEGAKDICSDSAKEVVHDLFIAVDSSSLDRLGDFIPYFERAGHTVCIDHHISNEAYAKENFVNADASSTCEVIYEYLDEDKITLGIAQALYIGIIFDTGVFKHSNTSRRTMEIAGVLMEKGVDYSKYIDECFYERTYTQAQLLGRTLLASMRVLDGRCIFSCVTRRVLEFYNGTYDDLDGIIDEMRITKGVEVAILLKETDKQEYKVSMRSNSYVDVSKIAVLFGGGGHKKAAGCTMQGSFHDVINSLTLHIEKQMDKHISDSDIDETQKIQ